MAHPAQPQYGRPGQPQYGYPGAAAPVGYPRGPQADQRYFSPQPQGLYKQNVHPGCSMINLIIQKRNPHSRRQPQPRIMARGRPCRTDPHLIPRILAPNSQQEDSYNNSKLPNSRPSLTPTNRSTTVLSLHTTIPRS